MKYLIFSVLLLPILIIYSFSVEIRRFNEFDGKNNFSILGGSAYNYGDSIFFYGFPRNKENPVQVSGFRLMLLYNGQLKDYKGFNEVKDDTVNGYKYSNIMGFVKDNNGDFIFGFDDGGMYKLTDSGFVSLKSQFDTVYISQVNSLLFDKDWNLWIHSNANLYKWDGKKLEKVITASKDLYFIPAFLGNGCGLQIIEDKVYFRSMKATLSYYDMKAKKTDTVSFYPHFKSNEYEMVASAFIGNSYYFSYYSSLDSSVHFGKYDGNEFTNLDYYLEKLKEGLPPFFILNFAIDKDMNFYFKILTGSEQSKGDSIFIFDKNMNMRKVAYKHLVNFEITLRSAFTLSNGEVYLPSNSEGFLIITNPTSVETPTNWLFMNKIYPNPAHDRFSIDFGVEPVNLGSMKVEIYDYLGRSPGELYPEIVYDSSTGKGTMHCEAGNLPKGMYIVVLSNGKYNRTMTLFLN